MANKEKRIEKYLNELMCDARLQEDQMSVVLTGEAELEMGGDNNCPTYNKCYINNGCTNNCIHNQSVAQCSRTNENYCMNDEGCCNNAKNDKVCTISSKVNKSEAVCK